MEKYLLVNKFDNSIESPEFNSWQEVRDWAETNMWYGWTKAFFIGLSSEMKGI